MSGPLLSTVVVFFNCFPARIDESSWLRPSSALAAVEWVTVPEGFCNMEGAILGAAPGVCGGGGGGGGGGGAIFISYYLVFHFEEN